MENKVETKERKEEGVIRAKNESEENRAGRR